MSTRKATIERKTKETQITCTLNLDGTGKVEVKTGLGFLDHMISSMAFHAGFDLSLTCTGDLNVDDHHTAEDCALTLGAALDQALGEKRAVVRFGTGFAPLDEALSRAVIDFSGRPFANVELPFSRESIGELATENIRHFFFSLAMAARMTLHLDLIRGDNDHHKAESAFKALALALKDAVAETGGETTSTKGVL
jgi:imidazoleglycerol phosphate dehydratase HisB